MPTCRVRDCGRTGSPTIPLIRLICGSGVWEWVCLPHLSTAIVASVYAVKQERQDDHPQRP